MDRKKNIKEIIPFLLKVRRKYSPEKIILFGSKARGDDWKQSDYDFVIVSDKFKNVHWLKRISSLVKMRDLPTDIDVLPYTPSEFNIKKKESSTVREALKHGILV